MNDSYSQIICESCNSKLSEFADFQNELIENQMNLYQHFRQDEEFLEEEIMIVEEEEEHSGVKVEVFAKEEEYEIEIESSLQAAEDIQSAESKSHLKFIIKDVESTCSKPFKQWQCSICNNGNFKTKSLFQRHMKQHKEPSSDGSANKSKSGRKMCQLCGLSFATNGWYHHILRTHTEHYRFICDFCSKGFRVKHDLKDHIKTHMSVESRKKFPCTACNAKLLSRSALKNHEQIFHSDVVEVHPCDCGKLFASRMKLYQHNLTVHTKGHFPCLSCEKTYTVKSALQKHIVKNHKTKVPCEVCGKTFAPGMFMNKHMKSHGPPQFKCSYNECSKEFHSRSALGYHIKSQHRPCAKVNCPTCGISYNSARNLNRHIARQHNNFRVQCEVQGCSHTAARKDYLASHYRSHKDLDENTRNILLGKIKEIKVIPW